MRNSVLWQRGKKIWRPKCAYFVWHPSGALLTRSREREGVCITDALPFGTPDQTLTGDLPLRRTSKLFYSVVTDSKIFQYLQCLISFPFPSAAVYFTPFD